MKRVIFNKKGGVGKTSISCNLGAAFAKLRKKVLIVDLDPQANSSQYLLGREYENLERTIADFFSSTLNTTLGLKIFKDSLTDLVQSTPFDGLAILPASIELADLQQKLESRYKIFKLCQALDELCQTRHFDEIIIDTAPALNFYTMSAFIAAERVLIPFDCDAFSAKALFQVMGLVEEVAADHRPGLIVEGVVINHFQAQAKLPLETVNALIGEGIKVIHPYLTSSVMMKESHEKSTPLVYLKPQHKLAQEYVDLAKNLLKEEKIGMPKDTKKKSDNLYI